MSPPNGDHDMYRDVHTHHDLERRIEAIESRTGELVEALEPVVGNLKALSGALEELASDIAHGLSARDKRIEQLKDIVATLNGELANLGSAVAIIDTRVKHHGQRLNDLEGGHR